MYKPCKKVGREKARLKIFPLPEEREEEQQNGGLSDKQLQMMLWKEVVWKSMEEFR